MFGGLQIFLCLFLLHSCFIWTSADGHRVVLDPREDIYFSEDPPDPWREFLDAYYYEGPLQENFYSRPVVNVMSHGGQFPPYNHFVPEMDLFRPVKYPVVPDQRDDAYNRYRSYFYSRYGTNFLDFS